jgi:hypothetical protein
MESSPMLVQEPGITTITFFSGVGDTATTTLTDYFRDHIQQVANANC